MFPLVLCGYELTLHPCFRFQIDKNIGNHYRSVICGRPTRCFLGPNYAFFLLALTLALLIGSATLMYLGRCVNVIAYFVQFIFFCAFIMSYLLVAFTDPGIIPKQTREQLLMELSQLEEEGVDLSHRKVCTDGCNIIRPPYTYHCASCDACIVGIDHHCPWTGHCIGENNKFFFTAFMWSMVPSLLGAIGTMLLYLYRASTGRGTCPSVEFSHTSYI